MATDTTKLGMSFLEFDRRTKDMKIKNNLEDVLYTLAFVLVIVWFMLYASQAITA